MKWKETLTFLRATGSAPGLVGAIVPSGAALARLITSEIGCGSGHVVEFGPGTGVFTRALLDQGVREKDLTLVEYRSDFAKLLQERFPEAQVLRMDAGRLHRDFLLCEGSVGVIVSGLPLLNMSPRKSFSILSRAFRCMEPCGVFYQFTYGPRCPVPQSFLDRLGLRATCLGRALVNLPPASVYRITNRELPGLA
ncbi:MAG TPA: rRNA adenine N-6-methyltransferase family protein [Terracidiphilus sp.]|nr:rRNA adenine N-6-methyltransferase family protein [Terracidiphilus sp.]